MSYQNQVDDLENQNNNENKVEENIHVGISSTNIRLGFIRKVYGILLFQLALTSGITALMMYTPGMIPWILKNQWFYWLDYCLAFVVLIVIMCCPGFARKVPTNYILLVVFTILFAFLVGTICAFSDPKVVLMAALMCLIVTLGLTAYACTTKTDFTWMGGILTLFVMVLIILGMFLWFSWSSTLNTIYCCLGVIVYGIYLIHDTQLIVGNHRLKFGIDEYIFASIVIYLDIIMLFLYILRLLKS